MSEEKMTKLQKIIAYTAIVTGIIAILVTFATSIHIMYHFFTAPACKTVSPLPPVFVNISGSTNEAIIISGGGSGPSYTSVEILHSNGSYWCSLPDLPGTRYLHTQSGLVLCGAAQNTYWSFCLTFSSGQWTKSHQLQHGRTYHSSWMSQHGIMLLGGNPGGDRDSKTTTEILTEDGQSSLSFKLKYDTNMACTIELDDLVVVTGGRYNPTRADVYDIDGWSKELPKLINGRWNHGCGKYINTDDKMIYLVTGGRNGDGSNTLLSSTETLVQGAGAWTKVGEFPVAIVGPKGVSLNNNIFMTGGWDGSLHSDSVLRFKPDDGTWEEVGKMQHARLSHGASTVNVDDVIDYCQ